LSSSGRSTGHWRRPDRRGVDRRGGRALGRQDDLKRGRGSATAPGLAARVLLNA
jgi:hypothetical protein